MKKKATTYAITVMIILILTAVVLAVMASFIEVFRGPALSTATDELCRSSAVANSIGRIGGYQFFTLNCPEQIVRVEKRDVDKEFSRSEIEYIEDNYNYGLDPSKYVEYRTDKIVADTMTSCWRNLGAGDLTLFGEGAWALGDERMVESVVKFWQTNFLKFDQAPVICVICHRIMFDEWTRENLQGDIDLTTWLEGHAKDFGDIESSYYDYLISDIHDKTLIRQTFGYNTQEPLAVVYARSNFDWHGNFVDKLVGEANALTAFKDLWNGKGDIPDALSQAIYGEYKSGAAVVTLIPYSQALDSCSHVAN